MKKLAAIGMGIVLIAGAAQADLLVQYGFNDGVNNTNVATSLGANLSASAVSVSSGTIAYGTVQPTTWLGSGIPYATSTSGWGTNQLAGSKYWEFTLTANSGYTFSLTNFNFLYRSTAAGPEDIGLVINGTTIDTFGRGSTLTVAYSTALTELSNLTSAVLRVHGWVGAEGTSSGGGEFRIDDLTLQGSVIPEPGTLVLLGLGGAFLGFVRRKYRKTS
jgi:hypothetical protein